MKVPNHLKKNSLDGCPICGFDVDDCNCMEWRYLAEEEVDQISESRSSTETQPSVGARESTATFVALI